MRESPAAKPPPVKRPLSAIPPGVWALGFVSMFMDISSEMIHALLPVYLVTAMGASTLAVGFIEGVAEATANIAKVFSGALSDRLGRRKALAALGYGLAAFTKPVFPLAASLGWIVAARFVDRIGKGVRGAPRDALVADLTPPPLRGAAYGLRQTLDTVGAFVGPLAAIALMALTANDFRLVFWIAVIPAFLSLALILFAVRDPDGVKPAVPPQGPALSRFAGLGPAFWRVALFAGLFALARFSEAFLVLAATARGLPSGLAPAVLVVMNVVYALASWPVGALSDRIGRRGLLAVGIAVLVAADLALATGGLALVFVAVGLWGLHMGLTQGLLAAMVADAAPASRRGAAFGVYNLVTGVSALASSLIAGALWDGLGMEAAFLVGAGFAALSALALFAARDHRSP